MKEPKRHITPAEVCAEYLGGICLDHFYRSRRRFEAELGIPHPLKLSTAQKRPRLIYDREKWERWWSRQTLADMELTPEPEHDSPDAAELEHRIITGRFAAG